MLGHACSFLGGDYRLYKQVYWGMAEFSTSEDRRARMSLVSLASHSERGRVPERSGVKGLIGRRDLLTGGPELSLQSKPMNPILIEKKKREALWRRSCSTAHQTWCDCGAWWKHVPGWRFVRGRGLVEGATGPEVVLDIGGDGTGDAISGGGEGTDTGDGKQ